MKRILVFAASLSLTFGALGNVASAQTPITTNADGSYVTSTAGVNPTANGGGGTIIYGDITTGPGYTVIGPPSVETGPAPEPEYAPAETGESAPDNTAVVDDTAAAAASDTDLDADNIADSLEWDLGLDPNNADSDGDGVADGDELAIYSTDPLNWDTDGDGISDGAELFGSSTDPLVWNEPEAAPVASLAQEAVDGSKTANSFQDAATPGEPTQSLRQEATESLTATDGDAAALGTGNASAAPGTVTRPRSGTSLLGPDGTYRVTDSAPSNVVVSGDVDVIAPLAADPPAATTGDAAQTTCAAYGDWYDAQLTYEDAGATNGDPAMVQLLDPDYDGIACEEGMQ